MALARPEEIQPLKKRPVRIGQLIYSHPGIGKSRYIGGTCQIGKTLILNADGSDGPESIRTASYFSDFSDNIEIADVANIRDLRKHYDFLRRGGYKEFDFVWLDSVTLFEEQDMDDIMRALNKEKQHRDIHLPDKPQYMLRQNHIALWVRDMRGLRINFGMTAHVMAVGVDDDEDADESGTSYRPAIQGGQGALSSKVCGYFGIVGRLYIKTTRVKLKEGGIKKRKNRVLQLQPSGKWYAKDRLSGGGLGDEVADPDVVEIVNAIKNGRASTHAESKVRRQRKRPRRSN